MEHWKLPDTQTRPYRVLVADPISAAGVETLRTVAEVDVKTGQKPEELIACIGDYDAVVVRSETKITREGFAAARKLRIVARAGVGVDNIDVPAATEHGVIVVNSPEGNTMAAAEHTIAMLMALSRKIPDAVASVRAGEWKRSKFVGVEVYKKTLGIIGFGKIGREVARRAKGLGMRILASDAFVSPEVVAREGAELVELADLYRQADYITVHAPLTKDTRGLIGDASLAQMKDGVRIINVARGGIVDEEALLRGLESGKVAGAALDVFEKEPLPADAVLPKHPLVIATPHLGASTEEAQVNVALDVCEQIVLVLEGKPPRSAVNMPAFSADVLARLEPFIELGTRMGRLIAQLTMEPIRGVTVAYSGELLGMDVQPVTRAVLVGVLQEGLEGVNLVNAPYLAEQQGLRVTESKCVGNEEDYQSFLRIEVETPAGKRTVGGTVLGRRSLRIREIDEFRIDLKPEGFLLMALHHDRPGVIGSVGTLLGEGNINIGGMYVGREAVGKRAVMVLTVDQPIPQELQDEIKSQIDADYVRVVEL